MIRKVNVEKEISSDLKEQLSQTIDRTVSLEVEIEKLEKEVIDIQLESDQMIGKPTNDILHILSDYKIENYEKIKEMTLSDFPYDIKELGPDSSKFVNRIFQDGENISVNFDEYSRSTFILKDEDGNEISGAYFNKEGKYYYVSVIMVAGLLDQKINSFVNALKKEDILDLTKIMSEIELIPTETDILKTINMYKESYDLETLKCEFVRANGNGFEYKLSGKKDNVNSEELLHVSFDDWWITILDYKGRNEWTGH
ncbi:hypothetical protein JCM19376_34660 [Fusibacter bizertensis]